ncbi:MAG: MerR family transcriptional regulator [Burkholderiaceae bacterium]|nr:MerR family transcriptional regulator [Burkholderiaceae bacterium]
MPPNESSPLPPIPAKRYFTIGEVGELCNVKPHVLRYWEQEFTQLRPMKRRGNRRYYQHHEVVMIRRIRDLLYEQGFTISGARNRLQDGDIPSTDAAPLGAVEDTSAAFADAKRQNMSIVAQKAMALNSAPLAMRGASDIQGLRSELLRIREILSLD